MLTRAAAIFGVVTCAAACGGGSDASGSGGTTSTGGSSTGGSSTGGSSTGGSSTGGSSTGGAGGTAGAAPCSEPNPEPGSSCVLSVSGTVVGGDDKPISGLSTSVCGNVCWYGQTD